MKRGVNDAHTCLVNGWMAGDIISPQFEKAAGPFLITAIGEQRVLGRICEPFSYHPISNEVLFSLETDDWILVFRKET